MSMTMDAPMHAPAEQQQMDLQSAVPVPDYATPGQTGSQKPLALPDYVMPELSAETPWYRRAWLAIGLVIVALYGIVVFQHFAAADSGVDQNAYLVGGRLLAEHFSMKYTLPESPDPKLATGSFAYVGGMMVRITPPTVPDLTPDSHGKPVPDAVTANPESVYYPKYPFGLPLLYAGFFWAFKAAAAMRIFHGHVHPEQAAYWAFLVSPVSSVLAIAGMFFLARQVAGSFAAALAAILLGTSQLMMMLMDNPNSHASCLAFIVWGMYFILRWMRVSVTDWLSGGRSLFWGSMGGFLVGYAATIRYSEILLFVAMCIVVLSRLPWNDWRNYVTVPSAAIWLAILALAGWLVFNQIDAAHAAKAGTAAAWTTGHKFLNITEVIGLLVLCGGIITLGLYLLTAAQWRMYATALIPGLAWAVPVGTLLLVNYFTLGSFTGYDSTHESEFGAAFQWKFFFQNWEKAIRIFYDMGLFFVVPFAIAGLVMLFRKSWRVGLLMVAWLVPGVMLYMAYYWSPDFSDAYARFFLVYMPALLVGVAVCFHDGILAGKKAVSSFDSTGAKVATGVMLAWLLPGVCYCTIHYLSTGHHLSWGEPSLVFGVYFPTIIACIAVGVHEVPLMVSRERGQYGNFTLTLAAGMVVVVAVGISSFRTIHGLRDGSQQAKVPINDFRERLSLAQTGQVLLKEVPAKSVLFAEDAGGISTPTNYIQFLQDWELYGADAFSPQGSRRGFGGGGGNNRRGNGGGGNGRGNGGGGRFAGGPGGGGNFGGGGANNNQDTTNTATPTQREQREYHAALYDNKTRVLPKLEAEVIDRAFGQKRRVFLALAKEHSSTTTTTSNTGFNWGGSTYVSDSLKDFKDNLSAVGHYKYVVISKWTDVALPETKDDDFELTDNSPMGGGGGRGGMNFGRMLMANDKIMDWQLVEVLPAGR